MKTPGRQGDALLAAMFRTPRCAVAHSAWPASASAGWLSRAQAVSPVRVRLFWFGLRAMRALGVG